MPLETQLRYPAFVIYRRQSLPLAPGPA